MDSILYPDKGEQYEDRSILMNAVLFTTGQRAYRSFRILKEPLQKLNKMHLAFLSVDAFENLIVSSEDAIGWIFVLRDWQPGTVSHSLFALLDRIQIGTKKWTEVAGLGLLEAMDVEDYRGLIHWPSSQELLDEGWSESVVFRIGKALQPQLDGFKALLRLRMEGERARVRGYNKSKHMLLGLLDFEGENVKVRLHTAEGGYQDLEKGIRLGGVTLHCEPGEIVENCNNSLQIQAILNDILRTILLTRYGKDLAPPSWVTDFVAGGQWRDSE